METPHQAIDLKRMSCVAAARWYGAAIIGAGVIALSGNVDVQPLSIIWRQAIVDPALYGATIIGAGVIKYTRAAVKSSGPSILAAKLAALAGRRQVGPPRSRRAPSSRRSRQSVP